MDFDFERHLGVVERSVASEERDGVEVRIVTMVRSYETKLDDLWDAATNAERLPRWFAPVSGDFKRGGHYAIESNAEGTIIECKPPSFLSLTWEFGENMSWVEARMSALDDTRSRLELSHIAPVDDHWKTFGPGATGVGWELGLVGLAQHLAAPSAERLDEEEFARSSEGKAFIVGSSEAWSMADIEAGESPERARSAGRETAAFYSGDTSGAA